MQSFVTECSSYSTALELFWSERGEGGRRKRRRRERKFLRGEVREGERLSGTEDIHCSQNVSLRAPRS